jgi:hypothetical protein
MAFLVLAVVTVISGLPSLAAVLAGAGCLGASAFAFTWYSRRELAIKETERIISRSLRKRGLSDFHIEDALDGMDLPPGAVKKAALRVYAKATQRVTADLRITEPERHLLDRLQHRLMLADREAERVEARAKASAYSRALNDRIKDGQLSAEEARDLRRIRAALHFTTEDAYGATKTEVQATYKELFRRFARDGQLSAGELQQLKQYCEATGLPATEAAGVTRKEGLDLYRRTAHMVCQDGEVTEQERQKLAALKDALALDHREVRQLDREVNRVAALAEIRHGDLPVLEADDLLLEGTELCHWRSRCRYIYSTSANNEKDVSGELVVTSKRVILASPQRSFDFAVKRILNIRASQDRVELQLTRKRGTGTYICDDGEKLEAILYALARGANFVAAERSDDARSRHIPDDVKTQVWRRDGGACVRCGASEYLEFDHIIPFSKGGANTVQNIQLLCRRCNLAKSDQIA